MRINLSRTYTTGKHSTHPEKEFKIPEYYLANLDDENPEEINYASKHPEIVNELKKLHQDWAIDVFKDSGYLDPNSDKPTVEQIKISKGTTKL